MIGSINPCGVLTLYDKEEKELGTCLDTPNSFAVACMIHSEVVKGICYYQHFGKEERIKDNDILERINTYTICLKKFSETKKDVEQIKKYIKFRKP